MVRLFLRVIWKVGVYKVFLARRVLKHTIFARGDRRSPQPGNRFVSFVRAYARSGCLVELDQK